MKIKQLYYLSLARSFSSKLPGVKISAIITEFSKMCNVELVAGRDFVFWKKNNPKYGNGSYGSNSNTSSYFKTSISEALDILHDFILFFYLLKKVRSNSIIWERSNRLHFSGLIVSKIKKSKYVLEWKDNLLL